MTFHDASKEFELYCKVRHLSPKTIDNYTKQLRYLENHLASEFSILNIEDVKPSHIKDFMAMIGFRCFTDDDQIPVADGMQ